MVRSGVLRLVLSGIVVGFRGVGGVLIRAGVGWASGVWGWKVGWKGEMQLAVKRVSGARAGSCRAFKGDAGKSPLTLCGESSHLSF